MTPAPEVQPLPYARRKYFFFLLFFLFVVLLPVFLFYAIGYRYEFFGEGDNRIVSTGGMYISANADDISMFLDDEFINDMRLFRNASYIQSIDVGVHTLNVQGEGLQTWVKELPVYPHIVTESFSFNLPEYPQVRLVTEYIDTNGRSVVFGAASTTDVLPFASSTTEFIATTSLATTTYTLNPEYEFAQLLFSTTSVLSTSLADLLEEGIERFRFGSATTTSTTSTSTKEWRNVRLFKNGEEVYAKWLGDESDTPYYYCVSYDSFATTSERYGEHIAEAISELVVGKTEPSIGDRVCRSEIRIDRKWQQVRWFDFYPNSTDLVLMLLGDGLYVVEVDDRAWQNVQLLYLGSEIEVVLNGGQIFILDGELYLEVFTELQS